MGIKVGIRKVARLAERMGIRTPISRNYAMTLGGLKEGVTVLDMAHAYETLAHNGQLVTGTLGAPEKGPVGIHSVEGPNGETTAKNEPQRTQVIPKSVAKQATAIMTSVVQFGTGKRAATGDFAAGKTGTTEDYGDAWFVGFNERYTVAVWVGYADKVKPMKTEYRGEPVAGGTYPAEIWHDFIVAAKKIEEERAAKRKQGTEPDEQLPLGTQPSVATPTSPAVPEQSKTEANDTQTKENPNGQQTRPKAGNRTPQPQQQQPNPTPTPGNRPQPTNTPEPEPQPTQPAEPNPEPAPPTNSPSGGTTAPPAGGATAPPE